MKYGLARGYARGTSGERKTEHVNMVEAVLGRELPLGAVVHHVNGNKADNRNDNFVVCPDQGYHRLIHARTKAMEATGNANAKPCRFCHEYEVDLSRLVKNGTSHYHSKCHAKYQREHKNTHSA